MAYVSLVAAAALILCAAASVEADGIMGWNCGGSIMVAHLESHATGGMMIRGYGPIITMQRIPLVRVVVRRFSLPQSGSSSLDQLDTTTRDNTGDDMRGEADVSSSKSDSQQQQQQQQQQQVQEQGYDAEDFAQHVDSLFSISHPLALFRDNLAELSRLHAMRTRALEILRERVVEQAASAAAAVIEDEQEQQSTQDREYFTADRSADTSDGDASSSESEVVSSAESSADSEDGVVREVLRYAAESMPADRTTRGLEEGNNSDPWIPLPLPGTAESSAEPSVSERREELLETVGVDDDDQAAVVDVGAIPARVKVEDDDVASSSFLDRLAYTMTGNTAADMDTPTLFLSLILLGLAFALLVVMMVLSLASIIYGCSGEDTSEEPRVVVVEGDNAKTPLLQTYEVHYGTKTPGDPMPISGAVFNPVGKYEPPEASSKA